MKKCTKCGIEKDESEFHKDGYAPDGLAYHCKECKKVARRKQYKKNPQTGQEWDAQNPDRATARRRRYMESLKNSVKENSPQDG